MPILNKDLVQKKTVILSLYITTTYINFQINFQISILNKEWVKVQNRRKSLCGNDLPLTPSHGDFPIGRETTLTQRDFWNEKHDWNLLLYRLHPWNFHRDRFKWVPERILQG